MLLEIFGTNLAKILKFNKEKLLRKPQGGGGGDNSHILGYRMCHFLRELFSWKINFWVYFVACNKFLGQVFSLE